MGMRPAHLCAAAWADAIHVLVAHVLFGELKLLRLDNLPSQRSDGMFKFLSAPAVPAAVGPSVGIIGARARACCWQATPSRGM